jgi:hypothetical protein
MFTLSKIDSDNIDSGTDVNVVPRNIISATFPKLPFGDTYLRYLNGVVL